MTIRAYATQWLRERLGRIAPNAQRSYRSAMVQHVVPALGDHQLDKLSMLQVRAWLSDQLAAGRPVNSVRAAHTALSTLLTDAMLDGLILSNVAHGASRRLWSARNPPPKALPPDGLTALLEASQRVGVGWARDLFTLGSRTGLRLGELLALHASDVHVGAPALRIERIYSGSGRFGPPKNGKARLVDISRDTAALLSRRMDAAPTSGWLFASPRRPDLPVAPCTVDHAFARARALAGLPEHYTVHSLRHTYASTLLVRGAPPQWVQQQLGHANYSITVDLYGSWFQSHRPDLVSILDGETEREPALPSEEGGRGPAKVITMTAWRQARSGASRC